MIPNLSTLGLLATTAAMVRGACSSKIQVETHVNSGLSLDMVSSLIIGSQAAVVIDMPMAIPQARELAAWVKNTTDKPLIAAFTTHFHPDRYLSGAEFLKSFPNTKYYANSKAVAQIRVEAASKVQAVGKAFGADNIVKDVAIPSPYDFTFFTLPGDEESPIHLLSPLTGDMSTRLSSGFHRFAPSLPATRSMQKQIESKGPNTFTPEQIFQKFNASFPALLAGRDIASSMFLLNASAEQFGRDGNRQVHFLDLAVFNSTADLEAWKFSE
ncbi:hypothetical protein BN1708_011569, partial [Verticillium longisporum]